MTTKYSGCRRTSLYSVRERFKTELQSSRPHSQRNSLPSSLWPRLMSAIRSLTSRKRYWLRLVWPSSTPINAFDPLESGIYGVEYLLLGSSGLVVPVLDRRHLCDLRDCAERGADVAHRNAILAGQGKRRAECPARRIFTGQGDLFSCGVTGTGILRPAVGDPSSDCTQSIC